MNKLTPQVTALYNSLQSLGIKCEVEYYDGHKHVDISIPSEKINIEVDGLQHYTNPDQILADFERSYWSQKNGFNTLHISNQIIETHLNDVANAIARLANRKPADLGDSELPPKKGKLLVLIIIVSLLLLVGCVYSLTKIKFFGTTIFSGLDLWLIIKTAAIFIYWFIKLILMFFIDTIFYNWVTAALAGGFIVLFFLKRIYFRK